MTLHRALVKLARVPSYDVIVGAARLPARPGEIFFDRAGLTLQREAPVVVDHDTGRLAGIVDELVELPDTDGTWVAARCTISDPPDWLRRGTKASFEYRTLVKRQVNGWPCVSRALVSEVSILSPGRTPVEARAQVALYHPLDVPPKTAQPAAVRQPVTAAGELVGPGAGAVVVRRNGGQVLRVY
ncbi:MAG: hypothetical protein ACXVRK_06300 [Gaiellaceae bacterium]